MANNLYMPLYIGDYIADASHLTTIEHGAYLLLIMHYWQGSQPLPNDDRKLARICRLTTAQWTRVKPTILEFFKAVEITENGNVVRQLCHSRIDHELARAQDKSLKRKKAGLARAKQMHSTSSPNAQLYKDRIGKESIDQEDRSLSNTENITTLHAFAGRTIRLTARDMETWAERYFAVEDLRAELGSLDDWISGQDEDKRKKWFHIVSGALNKKHQAAMSARRESEDGSDLDDFVC